MKELILNRNNRYKIDYQNIHGFVTFLETAKVINAYYKFYDNMRIKPVTKDLYEEKLKFI